MKILFRGPQRRQRKKEVPYDQSIYDFVVYRVFVATASFIIGDEATMLRRWVSEWVMQVTVEFRYWPNLRSIFPGASYFFFFSEYLYQAPSFLHGLQLNRSTAYYYIHFKWQKYHFSGIRRDLTQDNSRRHPAESRHDICHNCPREKSSFMAGADRRILGDHMVFRKNRGGD